MSVTLYDEALLKKIRSWVGDNRLRVISSSDVSNVLATTADQQNDEQIELPLIAITRQGFTIGNPNRTTMSAYGLTIETNPNKSEWLNAIPVELTYQIDIYTRYMTEANEYARNMIFNIVNFPRLTIELPYYDTRIPQNASIHLGEEIQDNSSIPERLIYGQFTRLTMTLSVNDAYLYDIRINDNWMIDAQVCLENEDSILKEI